MPVVIEVPLARLALVPDRRSHAGRLSIIFAGVDLHRGLGPVRKVVVPVPVANQDLLTALGRRMQYRLELELPADARRVAVTVRDDFRPMESTMSAAIRVPGLGRAAAGAGSR